MCDLVVSDESSVMAEGLMFGKMSIAVTDWLIPDTTPSRFAEVPMDYVIKCKKQLCDIMQNNSLLLRNHMILSAKKELKLSLITDIAAPIL